MNTLLNNNLLKVFINDKDKNEPVFVGVLKKDHYLHVYEYNTDITDNKYAISIRMPITQKIYTQDKQLLPYFDMFIPEGYLYEIFKSILVKNYNLSPYINDFYILKMLAKNITGRVEFDKDKKPVKYFDPVDLDYIKTYDTFDTFKYLLENFLEKNAISGVQPKTVITVEDDSNGKHEAIDGKNTIHLTDYIVKTWGNEYPYLAENEYFCMQTVKDAGIPIPEIELSKNKKFLIVKKFTDKYTGFEEVLGIFGYTRENKYKGSYERIAKLFQNILGNNTDEFKIFYKLIILNYLLGNGDAHLKNFGVLYDYDLTNIRLAPAYDIVSTIAYIKNDQPALTLEGRKVWDNYDALINFGIKYCNLSKKESLELYEECKNSVNNTIKKLLVYIKDNEHFEEIGNRMIDFWSRQIQSQKPTISLYNIDPKL
ncbi:conserved hypothetical protein (plasmid) [Deferribacter desulfuricans SSM1]|uniref:Uncharacterized protein n=1 Tax=Deferribacter desulfuricans (strain DSM 14783 / JCM 11476 / NBRC 101012 / SSM1) TaxID=639282 RepID=D3PEW6_DEFDS|nr:type II toxin-antitoxin system HipA family toxin [Deferribacter desulfuricans]BAI81758.1 conserved hypothetical protein [Deferribacter desulfuricans SSM1]